MPVVHLKCSGCKEILHEGLLTTCTNMCTGRCGKSYCDDCLQSNKVNQEKFFLQYNPDCIGENKLGILKCPKCFDQAPPR